MAPHFHLLRGQAESTSMLRFHRPTLSPWAPTQKEARERPHTLKGLNCPANAAHTFSVSPLLSPDSGQLLCLCNPELTSPDPGCLGWEMGDGMCLHNLKEVLTFWQQSVRNTTPSPNMRVMHALWQPENYTKLWKKWSQWYWEQLPTTQFSVVRHWLSGRAVF